MPPELAVSAVNERLLALLEDADDRELVRINPVRFAVQHGFTTGEAVELFLHARKNSGCTMEWQYVCPGCGEIVERLASLTSATAHTFCQVCSAERDADLSDFIEVTFSLARTFAARATTIRGRSARGVLPPLPLHAERRRGRWHIAARYLRRSASCVSTWIRELRRSSR